MRLDGRTLRAALCGLALASAASGACGGDGGAGDGEAAGGAGGLGATSGGASAAGRGGSAGGGGDDSGAGSGGATAAGSGAGGAGAGGSAPALEATPENLFPLAVGNRWTYRVTVTIPDSSPCPAGEHATEIVATSTVDGRTAFEATHVCDALNPEAVRFYAYGTGSLGMESKRCPGGVADCGVSWSPGLPRPIAEGATFQGLDGDTRTLHRVGSVTVPAGTFDECWETRGEPPSPLVSVYCQGIGPVAFSQKEEVMPPALPTFDYALELIAFDVQ